MITKFDKNSLTHVRSEVDKVLSTLGKDLGVDFELKNIRYQDNTFSVKLEGSIAGFDTRANDWDLHYRKFDLKKEWLHKTFQHNGETYKVVGLRPKARKQTVLVERDGETFQVEGRLIQMKFEPSWAGSNRQYNCDTGEVA
mgnify:FL=1